MCTYCVYDIPGSSPILTSLASTLKTNILFSTTSTVHCMSLMCQTDAFWESSRLCTSSNGSVQGVCAERVHRASQSRRVPTGGMTENNLPRLVLPESRPYEGTALVSRIPCLGNAVRCAIERSVQRSGDKFNDARHSRFSIKLTCIGKIQIEPHALLDRYYY